jgi:inhibitor of KinA
VSEAPPAGRARAGAAWRVAAAGDSAVILRLGDEISAAMLDRVVATMAALDARRIRGLRDLVPGYASVMVCFDPLVTSAPEIRQEIALGLALAPAGPPGAAAAPTTVEIPVFYDPEVAPDLADLAADKGLPIAGLVVRHSSATYRCHLLGFRPGFPFLGGLDPLLWTARLATPRIRVAAGSVAIGGRQTGIYPLAGPGGWRIVGRTPVVLFDPARSPPFLVTAGDRVKLVPVDRAAFLALGGQLGPATAAAGAGPAA